MKIDLSGKTALVSGSTAGIGLATAKGLAEAGANVIVNGRHAEAVARTVAALKQAGPGAHAGFVGDLVQAGPAAELVKAHPQVDVLVNNLGGAQVGDFFETPDEEWTRHFELNVLSGVRLARAYGLAMAERGWGRIVFVSSESALNIPVRVIQYGAAKTAQIAVARGLAKRLAGTGVTVNSVLPGPTATENMAQRMKPMADQKGVSVDEQLKQWVLENRGSTILRRPATAEEVANMIVYICSPQASATTGAAVRVDGGVVDSI